MRFALMMLGLCACLLAVAGGTSAAEPAGVPAQTSVLTDEAGALTPTEADALLARLRAIQHSGRAQVAILISSGTGSASLADYALRVAESWQLGRAGKDDGLLILVVPSIKGARIEVGYGLEGAIPDARASQWVDELIPAMWNEALAQGLERVLDRIDAALPQAETTAQQDAFIFDAHPEWKAPFVLVVFSLFSVFPLFFGRWGGVPGAFLLAAFMGGAAWTFWGSTTAGAIAAAAAFPLPLLWGLNWWHDEEFAAWLRYAKIFGNLAGVLMFFAILSLFVGTGLVLAGESPVPGFFFAGLLALGAAIFLFPGKPARYLGTLLGIATQFTFILVVAYVGLLPFTPDPSRIAFAVAAAVTACVALGLYLDRREASGRAAAGGTRWSLWLYGLAALTALPFALLALVMAIGGEDLRVQIAQGIAGGGSLAGILALAARVGLIAAVKVGLGGAFGGGGAGRGG